MLTDLKNRLKNLDRAEFRRKAISLSIAIFLHLLLIFYLRQARIYVKILTFQKATEVAIAQYPEVNLPRNLEEVIKHPPAPEDFTTGRKVGEKSIASPGETAGVPEGRGREAGAGSGSGHGMPAQKEQPTIPFDLDIYLASGTKEISPPAGLRLNLSTRFKSMGKHNFSLKIPVRPEPSPEAGKEEGTGPGLKGNVYQYVNPEAYQQARKSLRYSPAGKPRPGGTGAAGSGKAEAPSYHYDIKPWAEKVINLIQSKWVLPLVAVMPSNKNVALVLLVDRDGQLLSLEITNSTTSEVLDQAAVTAVRLCAPFPSLPADFPGKSLEFYLVFTYHD